MPIRVIHVPYDSGHRGRRMGAGPEHLIANGLRGDLEAAGLAVSVRSIEATSPFLTEIGSAFELHRELSDVVSASVREGVLPLVLSGNCNSSVGTVSGLQAAGIGGGLGVVWFDGHGDSNTPETFSGTFLDAMGLTTLTGRCWQALCATIPGYAAIPDERVFLVGGHGADDGALQNLARSGIGHLETRDVLRDFQNALAGSLDRMAAAGVRTVYLHVDLDVLDARLARANQFATEAGLSPDLLLDCIDLVLARFPASAAAIASYDPSFDEGGRVLSAARRIAKAVGNTSEIRP